MLYSYRDTAPKVHPSVFIAPNATIIGDVEIGENSSIWFNAVVRGDVSPIRIGKQTNIQDGSVLHGTFGKTELEIGNGVTVGHSAMVHGCTVEDNCLIGMGARILDGATIERDCLIAAGALVRQHHHISKGFLVAGVPAVVKRALTEEEIEQIQRSAESYVGYKRSYLEGSFRVLSSR
jgi:carbonic anhydrase/acetyltransferase-like protein (isoleucine patch superfamily)